MMNDLVWPQPLVSATVNAVKSTFKLAFFYDQSITISTI